MLITLPHRATEIYYSQVFLDTPATGVLLSFSFHSLSCRSLSLSTDKPYLHAILPLAATHPVWKTLASIRRSDVLALHYTRDGIYAMVVRPVIPQNHKVCYLTRLSMALPLSVSLSSRIGSTVFHPFCNFLSTTYAMKSQQRNEIEILLYEWPAENGRCRFIRPVETVDALRNFVIYDHIFPF